MQNETKLSAEMINSFFQMMKKSNGNRESMKKVLQDSLTETQKASLGKIMSDPQKLREVLSSPQAKALLEKLGNMQQGEQENGSP